MTDLDVELVDAVLHGGPDDLPAELRRTRIPAHHHKIKVPYRAGYEHFERAADTDHATEDHDSRQLIFRWTGRTAIAE
jgi:hypothetical protein